MEKIEIRNENGIHFAYFKNVKLPFLIESIIIQNPNGFTTANLSFEVDLEKSKNTFEIKGSDLIGILRPEMPKDRS